MAVLWTEITRYLSGAELKKGLSLRVTYVILQIADLVMTRSAISAGFQEINPVMRELLNMPVQLVIFKLIIPIAIAWLVPAKLLLPALALLLMVIGLNVKELLLPYL